MSVRCCRFIAPFIFAALVQPHWARALSKESGLGTRVESGAWDPPLEPPPYPHAYKIEIIRSFPHEGQPFTQGLEISGDGRHLIETSGSFPAGTDSFIRLVDPTTGKTLRSLKDGLDSRFIEGIVQAPNGHWFASTYLDKKALEYDNDLKLISEREYPGMGWGLTRSTDGASFLATNGSEYVTVRQKDTFQVVDSKVVTCMGQRVTGLNELEMVDNFMGQGPALLGNVYLSRLVLAVNPATGQCTGVFSLDDLGAIESNEGAGFHVANGLAYNKSSETLFATGKNWDAMFEVRIHPDPDGAALPSLSRHIMAHLPDSAPPAAMLFQVPSGGEPIQESRKNQNSGGKKNLMRS